MDRGPENKELRLDNRHLMLFFLWRRADLRRFFRSGFLDGARAGPGGDAGSRRRGAVQPGLFGRGQSTRGRRRRPGPLLQAGTDGSNIHGGRDPASPPDMRKELDFYSAVKDQSVDENFSPRPLWKGDAKRPARQPSRARRASAGSAGPTPGAFLHLQVAALRKRADANRLADELRGKGYPVVVVAPSKSENPQWIRVKVGPYRSTRETSRVKARLARDGYDSILRRQ